MATPNPEIEKYGWLAVPVSMPTLLSQSSAASSNKTAVPVAVDSVPLPSSPLAQEVMKYAKKELNVQTFNHSMRVFYYGKAILTHAFPTWSSPSFDETYFLTCLLHDIGTTSTNLTSTLLSFEFSGALLALRLLDTLSAPRAQADSVYEAVIRHQDLGDEGYITRIGALVQLATIFDNMGGNDQLVNRETIVDVVGKFPRKGWSKCFADTVRRENELKPWAHSSHLGVSAFPDGVQANQLMEEWDKLE